MGDFLDTRVVESEHCVSPPSTSAVLRFERGNEQVRFQLPIAINLRKGDKISFYQGCSATDHIAHDHYHAATVYRNNDELLSFDARDMRILTEARGYQEDSTIEEDDIGKASA